MPAVVDLYRSASVAMAVINGPSFLAQKKKKEREREKKKERKKKKRRIQAFETKCLMKLLISY